jgi:hypothetical protein
VEKRAGDFAFTEGPTCDAAGRLIACADERNELWSITPDGKATTIGKGYGGKATST